MTGMSPDEKGFHTRLVALASMVPNFVLTEVLIDLYDRMLSPLGYGRVNQALDQIILDRSSRDPFPALSEIRAIVEPTTDPESEAQLSVNRIIEAVAKFGTPNHARAKAWLTGREWSVIKGVGGWERVCQDMPAGGNPAWRSQMIKFYLALRTQSEATPALEGPSQKQLSSDELIKLAHQKADK